MAKSSYHRPECPFVVTKPRETELLMKEDFVMIQALVKRGVYQQDIATMLGVHPKTLRRADGAREARKSARPVQATGRRLAAGGLLGRRGDLAGALTLLYHLRSGGFRRELSMMFNTRWVFTM